MSDSAVTVLPRIVTPWDSLGKYIEVWQGNERKQCWGPYIGYGPFTEAEFQTDLKKVKTMLQPQRLPQAKR